MYEYDGCNGKILMNVCKLLMGHHDVGTVVVGFDQRRKVLSIMRTGQGGKGTREAKEKKKEQSEWK